MARVFNEFGRDVAVGCSAAGNTNPAKRCPRIDAMPGHAKTLNPRQVAFVQNVVFGAMSYTDAARKANYKDSPTLRIKAALDKEPGVWHVKYAAGGYGSTGIPDLLLCVRGHFVALEVKQPGSYATQIQRHVAVRIRAAGGVAVTVRSVDEALAVVRGIITP